MISCTQKQHTAGKSGGWDHNLMKFDAIKSAIKNNDIQKARDLVSTTTETNDLYVAIRENQIQKARNIVDVVNY